jgi:hypothetical protein
MSLSRRMFLKRAALAGGALASASAITPSFAALTTASAPVRASEVVTFFDGQLWLDTSGASRAWRPPLGAHTIDLTEAQLHCLYGRL